MADIVPVVADVDLINGLTEEQPAGVDIDQGDFVYLDSNREWQKTDANALVSSACDGMALNAAKAGQPLSVAKPGVTQNATNVDLGATLAVTKTYVLSENAGKIKPVEDINTGEYVTYVGAAITAANLSFQVHQTGVTAP